MSHLLAIHLAHQQAAVSEMEWPGLELVPIMDAGTASGCAPYTSTMAPISSSNQFLKFVSENILGADIMAQLAHLLPESQSFLAALLPIQLLVCGLEKQYRMAQLGTLISCEKHRRSCSLALDFSSGLALQALGD